MYQPSLLTVDINKAILSASNPDLGYRERKELKRQLRYYIAHPDMPESTVSRCQTALQQVLDMKPAMDRFIDQFLYPILVGVVILIIWNYAEPIFKQESLPVSSVVEQAQPEVGGKQLTGHPR